VIRLLSLDHAHLRRGLGRPQPKSSRLSRARKISGATGGNFVVFPHFEVAEEDQDEGPFATQPA
jgi:hypothetical protein